MEQLSRSTGSLDYATLESAAEAGISRELELLPSPVPPALPSDPLESKLGAIGFGQRAFDLGALFLLLPLLLPLGLLVSLVVFLDSPGSVLFRARRIGLGGRPFSMLKFRTMRSDSKGPPLTRLNDDRFTPVGRFLAATRLDEMPQLWHVLKGEMRLIGPRPEDPEFVRMFAREYEEILLAPPGITGSTQLVHFADGASLDSDDPLAHYAEHILPRKLELDAEYVRRRNLWLDLRIVGRTLVLPLRLAGAGFARVALRHHSQAAITLAGALLLLVTFAVAGGPAR